MKFLLILSLSLSLFLSLSCNIYQANVCLSLTLLGTRFELLVLLLLLLPDLYPAAGRPKFILNLNFSLPLSFPLTLTHTQLLKTQLSGI